MHVYGLLNRHNIPIWWDALLNEKSGGALNAEILQRLEAADAVIAMISAQSLSSMYCRAELLRSLEIDKPMVRVEVEPAKLPPELLLPLSTTKSIPWHSISRTEFDQELLRMLAQLGVGGSEYGEGTDRFLDEPDLQIIRPSFSRLANATQSQKLEFARRLTKATELNPDNGYNLLSLALLLLSLNDRVYAFEVAKKAASKIPQSPDAHYAVALCYSCSIEPQNRRRDEVESMLRTLAVARRLPQAGAHIDLLSALIIANYYIPRFATPPETPEVLLRRGLEAANKWDPAENARVMAYERCGDITWLGTQGLYDRYGLATRP